MSGWRRWIMGVCTVWGVFLWEAKNTWLVSQLCTTAGSMLVSLVIYAYAFGWQFATGFVLLLLAHEWGHVFAIKLLGLGARGPLFIPFLGAVVQLKRPPRNVKGDAGIALAGPALGTLSALLCLVVYLWIDSKIWLVLAYTGSILNLFNLIPCGPLDGGKVAPAISSKLWVVGLLVLCFIFYKTWNPFLFVIILFSLMHAQKAIGEKIPDEYYFVAPMMRFKIAIWYFVILGVLSVTTIYTHQMLQ